MLGLEPGSVLGVLGGGQLGRMIAHAAARLGYHTHIYTDRPGSPATRVTPRVTLANYEDEAELARFAQSVDAVTLEFENIPTRTLELLAPQVPVRPGARVLATCQDRILERAFLADLGAPHAPVHVVTTLEALEQGLQDLGCKAVLKTARFGYDGHGQARLEPGSSCEDAWSQVGGVPSILEAFVAFEFEISVVVARDVHGHTRAYTPVRNEHRNHVLWQTHAPAELSPEVATRARDLAVKIADALGLEGVLAVEMFVMPDGELWVNELAPRPHNSGHWTMDACVTSQFEQLVRAACGLPLGDTTQVCPARMTNLLGDDIQQVDRWLQTPGARVHLYGKSEVRPGRKMGHVTELLGSGS